MYTEDGFLIIKSPRIIDLKSRLAADIDAVSGNYDLLPTCPAIMAMANDPVFIDAARGCGIIRPLMSTPPMVRVDRPMEDKHLTPAHQDFWYSMLSENAVTIWMPVYDVTPAMGRLLVVPGSHLSGKIPFIHHDERNPFTTERMIPDSEFVEIDLDQDEMLVFSQMLVHKSGFNRSGTIRYSLQVRYNDLETLKEKTSSYTPKPSAWVLRQWEAEERRREATRRCFCGRGEVVAQTGKDFLCQFHNNLFTYHKGAYEDERKKY